MIRDDNNQIIVYLYKANFNLTPTINYEQRYQAKIKELASMIYPDNEHKQDDFVHDFSEIVDSYNLPEDYSNVIDEIIKLYPEYVNNRDENDNFIKSLISDPTFL